MRITWYVTALLLFGATVFARTGETEAQIEKRYGRPTSGSRWTKTYSNKNLFIIVTFDNGVSGIETFQKRNDSPMARAEIEKLLEANSDGANGRDRPEMTSRFPTRRKLDLRNTTRLRTR
jgi:hypothetical protein